MDDHPTPPAHRVDIPTAAQRLGISPAAVRKRIARGTLRCIKENGRWYVILLEAQDMSHDVSHHAGTSGIAASYDAVLQVYRERVADKDGEIKRLTDLLERRDEEVRRVHVLLQQAQQLTDQRQTPASRSWWRWWRRDR